MKNNQFIILVLVVLIWIMSVHYVVYKQPEKIIANILAIEYDKVWWIENYAKISKLTREQTIAWLKQYESQNWQVQAPANNEVQAPSWPTISLDQAKKITKDWTYILWNPDADITWVEYSDLDCFYCNKLHKSWTIEEIIDSYDWNVNFVFKQFPLPSHPNAEIKSQAALCWWSLSWSEKYYEFVDTLFNSSNISWNNIIEKLSDLWSSIWINKEELSSCLSSSKFKSQVQSDISEWRGFWVSWTPWNVLINNKTGSWDTLSWAYPTESFKQKIDELLN